MECRICGEVVREWLDVGFNVYRCKCGFIGSYLDVSKFYKEYGWESEFKDQPQIKDELSLLKVGDLLEIGCNSGTFLEEARLKGFNVFGIDASPDVVFKARSKGLAVKEGYFGQGLGRKFDVIVARHVLEHVIDLKGFCEGIKESIRPGGQVLIEVPDFDFYVKNFDYSCFWEQHVNYFNEDNLRSFFNLCGLNVLSVKRFDFSGRSIMMLGEASGLSCYAENFPDLREKGHKFIKDLSKQNRLALYGAGCRSETLVNLFDVAPYIYRVFDDHSSKIGKKFIGKDVERPDFSDIDVCLLGVNEENEQNVREKHKFDRFIPFFKNFWEGVKIESI